MAAITIERITLQKFAASIGLAAEQVKDFLGPSDVACALVTEAWYRNQDRLPRVPLQGEPEQWALTRRVAEMLYDPDDQDWHR